MPTLQSLADRLRTEDTPWNAQQKRNLLKAAARRHITLQQADESITDAVSVKRGDPPPDVEPQTNDKRLLRILAGDVNGPAQLPPEFRKHNAALEAARAEKARRARESALVEAKREVRRREIAGTAEQVTRDPVGEAVPLSPTTLPIERTPTFRPGELPPEQGVLSNDPRVLMEQARQSGVDIRRGGPMSTRMLASLADIGLRDGASVDPNIVPGMQYLVLDRQLRPQAKVPDTVPVVYKEPNTGELVYLRRVTADDVAEGRDPQRDIGKLRPTLIDPQGMDLGDIAEFVPDLASGVGEALTSVVSAGAAAPLGPTAAVLAGSAGASLYAGMDRPARVALIKSLTGLTDKEIEASGAATSFDGFSAAIAGAGESGAAAVIALRRRLKNRKRPLSEEDVIRIQETVAKNRQLFEDVEQITGVKIFPEGDERYPRELLTEDPNILVEANANLSATPPWVRRGRLAAAARADINVADATRSLINSNTPGNTAFTPNEIQQMTRTDTGMLTGTGRSADVASGEAAQKLSDPVFGAQRTAEAMQQQLDAATSDIPRTVNRGTYRSLQKATDDAVSAMRTRAAQLWNTFDSLVEYHAPSGRAGIVLANPKDSPMNVAGRRLMRQAKVSLSEGSATKKHKLVADLEAALGENAQTLDLKQLHVLHSELKQLSRTLAKGAVEGIGFSKADVDSMISAIEQQVARGQMVRTRTGRTLPKRAEDIRLAWLNASDATMQLKRIGQARAVRDLLVTKPVVGEDGRISSYRFTELPSNVRTALLKPNDATVLYDVLEAAGESPELKSAIGQELLRQYRSDVMPDGKWKQLAHENFMASYGDHMEKLFGSDTPARILNIETLGQAVDKATQQAKQVERVVKQNFGALVDTTDPLKYPSNMAETMLTQGNVNAGHIKRTMRQLEQVDPKLAADIRIHAGQWIENKLLEGKLPRNADAYTNLVRTHGDRLSAMFGQQFVADLRKLGRVTGVLSGEVMLGGPKDPQQAAWLQVTRTLFGPLSNIQRRITAGSRIYRHLYAMKSMQVLADPDKLRRYIRLEKLSPNSLAFRAEMYSLFGREVADSLIGEDPEYDSKVANFGSLQGALDVGF